MSRLRALADLGPLAGRIVLVRVDYNVPLDPEGRVADDSRIRESLPTIRHLRREGARVVLLSHLGRPKGARRPEFSLRPVLPVLEALVGEAVVFAEDCIGAPAAEAVAAGAGVTLLENLRFHAGEERDDPEFARALAALGEAYVNDAFSVSHRAHASVHALAGLLPAAAGLALAAEVEALERVLGAPERPLAALVGGAKISTKIPVIENLLARVDHLLIGGAMANTFLKAGGRPVGRSLVEDDQLDTARRIMAAARDRGLQIHLPEEVVVAPALDAGDRAEEKRVDEVAAADMILDFAPATVERLLAVVGGARSFVWNGPLGAFEHPPFDRGTIAFARGVAELTETRGLLSVAGGGDTLAALNRAGVRGRLSHVSSAGGAFLEWLEGRTLPGIAVLMTDG
ncbi:MAG: phosphoglycerate kinase [Rhodothalassiaceae bacterium]|nr:MAG: phosphoglycerate kinase [Rhodothalassiaceae bacterium]